MHISALITRSSLYLLVFSLVKIGSCSNGKKYNFKVVYEWKQIEYKFQSEEERSEAINNGTFKVGKVQPIDAQYTYNGYERIFVTTARQDPTGIPATLGIITNKTRDGNPIIDPYPSWSWNINPEECNYYRVVSVYRTWLDECDRLWVIDSGVVGNDFVCPPQILAFDIETDALLHKYEIPYDQHLNASLYITPVAEIEYRTNRCVNTWLYIADTIASSLLVYSLAQNTSWTVRDKSFEVDPSYTNFTIGDDTVTIADGIFTVDLSPATDGPGERKLRYHAMSSVKESWVYLKHLKNRSNFVVPYGSPDLFSTYKHTRNQQSSIEASDRKGNLYFTLLIDTQVAKWDPRTAYKQENFQIIADSKTTLQLPTGLKVLPYEKGITEKIWVFSTAYQRYAAGTLNGNVTNFRLLVAEL